MSQRQRRARNVRRRHHAAATRGVMSGALAIGLALPAAAAASPFTALQVQDINQVPAGSNPSTPVAVGSTAFFAAFQPGTGTELWKSDGTPGGTVLVKDILPGAAGSQPKYLTNVAGTLYFTASDGTHGTELWKSDGTAAGTVQVKDINNGSAGSFVNKYGSADLTNVNGRLFFAANDGTHGIELWKSDGTEGGTALVQDIQPGSPASTSAPGNFTAVG